MKHRALIAMSSLLLAAAAQAQLLFEPVTVHPANVARDAPFLILIEDSWADGCGGTVSTRVSAQSIEIEATLSSPTLGLICTAALVPFKELINPRDVASVDFEFAEQVTINYRVDNGNGAELRFSRQLDFSDEPNPTVLLQSGGWVTPGLERSGLFIDQQGGILSAALFDYGADDLASWHYAAGPVNGNVFSAEMSTFGLIVCVTAPCDRAAPVSSGRINVLLRNANEAIVDFAGIGFPGSVLDSSEEAVTYRRLDFSRSAELPIEPVVGELAVPDLVGSWVGGMVGAIAGGDDFRAMDIEYAGFDSSHGVGGHRFNAFNAVAIAGQPEPAFQILCADNRPVDGPVGCSLEGYRFGADAGVACEAFFAYAAVAEEGVRAQGSCAGQPLQFELYRRR